MDIKFEEPHELARVIGSAQQVGKYEEFALALREYEGQWAVLPDRDGDRTEGGANATAQNIRNGKVKGFAPKDSYEVALRGTKIWVRYKGQGVTIQNPEPDEDIAKRVRRWAEDRGIEVADKGRIPKRVMEQWAEDTGNDLPVRSV